MTTVRTTLPTIFLSATLCLFSADILAKRPSQSEMDQCLGKRTIYRIARNSLQEFHAIDPSVTLTDVKAVIRSAGECATREEINLALEQYSNDLLSASQTNDGTNNATPMINGIPETAVNAGVFYSFTPSAYDPDGDSLTFSITNLPHWATFDATTGAIYGTPAATDINLYQNIVIAVSDGNKTASLSGFDIDVMEVPAEVPSNPLDNQITGYTIYMGTSPDTLALQTTLDTRSEISFSAELTANNTFYFSIIAHDINGNNIFLTNPEISGYRIYAGTSSDSLFPVKDLSSEADTQFQISGLYAGTFFLSVAAFDIHGNEGPPSSIAQLVLM
jgi:histone H3/H4